MTALPIGAIIVANLFFILSIYLWYLLEKTQKELSQSREDAAGFKADYEDRLRELQAFSVQTSAQKQELSELKTKFEKNPSYECQQLLANLLSGHALFHIETIDPENVLIRRR